VDITPVAEKYGSDPVATLCQSCPVPPNWVLINVASQLPTFTAPKLLTSNLVIPPALAVSKSPEPRLLIMNDAWPPAFGWTRTVPLPAFCPSTMLPLPFDNRFRFEEAPLEIVPAPANPIEVEETLTPFSVPVVLAVMVPGSVRLPADVMTFAPEKKFTLPVVPSVRD